MSYNNLKPRNTEPGFNILIYNMNPVSIYRLTILNPPIKYRPSGSIYYGRDILKPSIIVITNGEGVQHFMAAIF